MCEKLLLEEISQLNPKLAKSHIRETGIDSSRKLQIRVKKAFSQVKIDLLLAWTSWLNVGGKASPLPEGLS